MGKEILVGFVKLRDIYEYGELDLVRKMERERERQRATCLI